VPLQYDPCDAELVASRKWQFVKPGRPGTTQCYAVTQIDGKTTYLHRLITKAPKGMDVDHINGDGLDNRRCNLRVVTHAVNQQNRQGCTVASKTGERGVYLTKFGTYRARIKMNCKYVFYGRYDTLEEATVAIRAARARLSD
jgi:hypothetical protein